MKNRSDANGIGGPNKSSALSQLLQLEEKEMRGIFYPSRNSWDHYLSVWPQGFQGVHV